MLIYVPSGTRSVEIWSSPTLLALMDYSFSLLLPGARWTRLVGGFFVSSFNYNISIEADLLTLAAALNVVTSFPFQIINLFVSNPMISTLIHSSDFVCSSHLRPCIDNLKHLLVEANTPCINSIPRQSLQVAFKLAGSRRNLHELSLFHSGWELPQWLMKCFSYSGFVFD